MNEPANPAVDHEDLRSDIELLFRVYRDLVSDSDRHLRNHQLGRLHHQLLLCISRRPEATVSHYLSIMKLTKQTMSRLIRDLLVQELIGERTGTRDRRERFLQLTEKGRDLERQLTESQSRRFARLYKEAGPEGLECFRRLMCALLDRSAAADVGLEAAAKADRPLQRLNGLGTSQT